MRLELFPFRYRDHVTGKWVRARYRAERYGIAKRYAEFEIIGPAEIRGVDPEAKRFTPRAAGASAPPNHETAGEKALIGGANAPFAPVAALTFTPECRGIGKYGEDPAALDEVERFLLLVFPSPLHHALRMVPPFRCDGAARLFRELVAAAQ